MPAILRSIVKKIIYIAVLVLVIAALMVMSAWLFSPVLNRYKPKIEQWATQLITMPVVIDKVHLSWHGYQPQIDLEKVTILSQETKEPVLQIKQVSVFFSIPKSIWQWQPIPSGMNIKGTEVDILETENKEFVIKGFPAFGGFNTQPFQKETRSADILGWLFSQPHLILRDINVRYTGFTGQKRFVTFYNLSLENKENEHVILGKAILHQELPTEFSLAARLTGNEFNLAKIDAKIYLYVSGFSLSQWLKNYSYQTWRIDKGVGSAKIWATWSQGSLQKIQTSFQFYDLELYSTASRTKHIINRLSGNGGWRREGNTQIFAADDLLLDLPSHLWPVTNFYAVFEPDVSGSLTPKSVNIGYLDLQDAQKILFSSPPILTEDIEKILRELQLKGSIQNALITFTGPWNELKNVSVKTQFHQLSFLERGVNPGLQNLSGQLEWSGNQGNLSLRSRRVILTERDLFAKPIPIDQLTGEIGFQQTETKTLILQPKSLQILNTDLAANLNGSITLPASGPVISDLNINFTMQKVDRIKNYLPMRLFEPGLIQWLDNAFQSGEIQSGNAIIRGSFSDFANNNDILQISAKVKDIDLNYAPGWPRLTNATGALTFLKRNLIIDLDHAQIQDIEVQKVHGEIPDLVGSTPLILTVETGEITADFSQGLKFLRTSPLKDKIGKMFQGIEASGPIILKLGLTVPINQPDNTNVRGNVLLKNAEINLLPWKLKLQRINGQFQFTQNSAQAENINGLLFNQPIQLNLAAVNKTKDLSILRASFKTNLQVTNVESWLNVPVSKFVHGSADIEGEMDFSLTQTAELRLRSNLVGLAIDFPDPKYAKKNR